MQDTFSAEKRAGGVLRLFIVGVLTIATTLGVNLVLRTLAYASLPISPIFLPLQIGSISVFTVVLVGGGVLVYAAVTRFSKRPARTYTLIGVSALLLSLIPNVLLLLNPDTRTFPGVTRLATSILILFHIVDAGITIMLLTRLAPSKGRVAKEAIRPTGWHLLNDN